MSYCLIITILKWGSMSAGYAITEATNSQHETSHISFGTKNWANKYTTFVHWVLNLLLFRGILSLWMNVIENVRVIRSQTTNSELLYRTKFNRAEVYSGQIADKQKINRRQMYDILCRTKFNRCVYWTNSRQAKNLMTLNKRHCAEER